MKLPDDVDPKDVMHPKTGLFFRNPSNLDLRNRAETQSQIVKELTEAKRTRQVKVFTYTEDDMPFVLPGILKIRELEKEQLEGLFKSVIRIRPNIFKIHIKLGEYSEQKPIINNKVSRIGSSEPRHLADVAKDLADVFADKRFLVTELIYSIHSAELGNFSSSCEAWGTTEKQYENNKLFNPGVLIEYFLNH